MKCGECCGKKYIALQTDRVPRRICNAVFDKCHGEIREGMNFQIMYPLLKSSNLLLQSEDYTKLSNPELTREAKIDMVVDWIPNCGHSDYLTPFIQLLRDTVATAGDGHKELADKLEERKKTEVEKDAIVVTKRCAYRCLAIPILILTVLLAISLLVFLLALPHLHHVQNSEHSIFDSATIPLDRFLDTWWLAFGMMAFSMESLCTGQVGVITGKNCSELPKITNHVGFEDEPCHIYALPGSSIEVTLPNSNNGNTMPHVWFTRSIETYKKMNDQVNAPPDNSKVHQYRCNKKYPDADCYAGQEHLGSSVTLNITVADYYCVFLTNTDDTGSSPLYGITWSYTNITYNFTEMENNRKDYPLLTGSWAYMSYGSPAKVKMTSPFGYREKSCALFHFVCGGDSPQFSISPLLLRWDVPLLMSLVYLMLVVALLAGMLAVRCAKCNRCSKTFLRLH